MKQNNKPKQQQKEKNLIQWIIYILHVLRVLGDQQIRKKI